METCISPSPVLFTQNAAEPPVSGTISGPIRSPAPDTVTRIVSVEYGITAQN